MAEFIATKSLWILAVKCEENVEYWRMSILSLLALHLGAGNILVVMCTQFKLQNAVFQGMNAQAHFPRTSASHCNPAHILLAPYPSPNLKDQVVVAFPGKQASMVITARS